VYQIGDIYFVKDGNHRVSVARANGFKDIEAYVTRVDTPFSDYDTRPEILRSRLLTLTSFARPNWRRYDRMPS